MMNPLIVAVILTVFAILGFSLHRRNRRRFLINLLEAEEGELMECYDAYHRMQKGESYLRKGVVKELRERLDRLGSLRLSKNDLRRDGNPITPVINCLH